MRVVHGQPPHPGQAVDDARALVAVDGAELEEPQRQLTVRAPTRAEDQVVHGAVHGLEVVLAVLQLHRREHCVRVVRQVPGGLEQPTLGDVRGADVVEALLDVPAADVVLHLPLDHPASGVEHRQAGADLVGEAEQVQLGAEAPMVAALGLGQQLLVRVQRLLGLPGGAVDALQAGLGLVAPPVGRRATGDCERGDVFGGRHVRAAAQVAPDSLAGAGVEVVIDGEGTGADLHDFWVVHTGLVTHQLQLERLRGELDLGGLDGGDLPPGEPLRALDDLPHPLLDRGEVVRSERTVQRKVVVEAVGDRWADTELGLGKQLLDGLGHDVRGGVPDDHPPVRGVGRDGVHLGVGLRGPREVAQLPVRVAHHDHGVHTLAGQTRLAYCRACRRSARNGETGCGGDCHGRCSSGSCCWVDELMSRAYRPDPTGLRRRRRSPQAGGRRAPDERRARCRWGPGRLHGGPGWVRTSDLPGVNGTLFH